MFPYLPTFLVLRSTLPFVHQTVSLPIKLSPYLQASRQSLHRDLGLLMTPQYQRQLPPSLALSKALLPQLPTLLPPSHMPIPWPPPRRHGEEVGSVSPGSVKVLHDLHPEIGILRGPSLPSNSALHHQHHLSPLSFCSTTSRRESLPPKEGDAMPSLVHSTQTVMFQ